MERALSRVVYQNVLTRATHLKKAQRVGFIRINQREHLRVLHAPASCEPLKVPKSVSPAVSTAICVVGIPFDGGGQCLKAAVWVSFMITMGR